MAFRNSKVYRLVSIVVSLVRPRLKQKPETNANIESSSVEVSASELERHWHWFQPELVNTRIDNNGIVMQCLTESVWFQNLRGPMLYRDIKGNFSIEAHVEARQVTQPHQPPSGQWQFGGIIVRDPASDWFMARENYVFNVVGCLPTELKIETKSTVNGFSHVRVHPWESGDAWLKIVRCGARFELLVKTIRSENWKMVEHFDRPDFPKTVQLGLICYAYSKGKNDHNLQVRTAGIELTHSSLTDSLN